MMTLEVAILYHTEEAEKLKLHKKVNEIILGTEGYERALQEHTQTAEWLKELQERRKTDSCEGCVNESGKSHLLVCCTCRRHYHYADLYKPERRTDE